MSEASEAPKRHILIIGQRRVWDGNRVDPKRVKVVIQRVDVDTDEPLEGDLGIEMSFETKLAGKGRSEMARWRAAQLYEVPLSDEGTIWAGHATFRGQLGDRKKAAVLQTRERAERAVIECARAQAKNTGREAWEDALTPVRDAYSSATGLRREMILAQAVSFITRTAR